GGGEEQIAEAVADQTVPGQGMVDRQAERQQWAELCGAWEPGAGIWIAEVAPDWHELRDAGVVACAVHVVQALAVRQRVELDQGGACHDQAGVDQRCGSLAGPWMEAGEGQGHGLCWSAWRPVRLCAVW